MTKPGDRVGVLRDIHDDKAYLYGYGTFDGYFPIPEPVTKSPGIPSTLPVGLENPRITLENGKVIWGCECWWGPAAAIQERVKGLQVVEVDIDKDRADAKLNAAEEV